MALEGWAAMALGAAGAVPSDATPFVSANTTDITSTTPVTIKAATALKSIYVTKLLFFNKTPAEAAILSIEDNTGTPIVHLDNVELTTAAGNEGYLEYNFDPPMQIAVGKALMGKASGSFGDTIVFASGFVGTPGTTLDGVAAIALRKVGSVPDDAAAMNGYNSTLVTSTTAREVVAASASKSHYIQRLKVTNATPAETAQILIQDGAGTPVNYAGVVTCTAASNAAGVELVFEPPLQVAVGEPINAVATGAFGDVLVEVSGFTGTP